VATFPETPIDSAQGRATEMTPTQFAALALSYGWLQTTIDSLVRRPLSKQVIFIGDGHGNSKRVKLIDDAVTPLR
jgi:hypothetical protein